MKHFYLWGCVVYVSPHISGVYLSQEVMVQLQIVNTYFLSVVSVFPPSVSIFQSPDQSNECECPQINLPLGSTDKLPFPCIPENIEHMKQWLLDRYKGSTFNTCPHQIFPKGPTIELHVDQQSKLVASYTPAQIPLH